MGFGENGKFTIASLYKELTFPGVENREIMSIWRARLPLKTDFFSVIHLFKLSPFRANLVKHNWHGDEHCKMCGNLETTQHIFFECHLANYCWWIFHDALFWTQIPTNLQHFLIFLLACICWILWLIRNDFVFNNKVISNPNVVVHRSIIFMQKWSILLKEKERDWILKTVERLSRILTQSVQD